MTQAPAPSQAAAPSGLFTCPQARAGAFLLAAVLAALLIENSPFQWIYEYLLHMPVEVTIGPLELKKSLLLWVNDGLMAVFFFLIGLEVKCELLAGELSSVRRAALPAFAAVGGMLVPALIYLALNHADPVGVRGWAIPAATDIAFALGVVALLGTRVPPALKILLLSLAIIDDIGAIAIIALFYSEGLSWLALGLGGAGFAALMVMNRLGVTRVAPYIIIGVIMWVCVLKSGVHATLAGVLLAMAIPLRTRDGRQGPLEGIEHALHPWVTWAIMPLFAFMNAGVTFLHVEPAALLGPVPLGIVAGLVLGKQIGITLFIAIGQRLGACALPDGVTWRQIWGLSLLCGIGFTMSLFIGTLAFGDDPVLGSQLRVSVLAASLISGVSGYLVLRSSK